MPPLLFLCGNLAHDTLSLKLESVGLRVNRVVCYDTTRDSAIEQSLHLLNQQGVSEGFVFSLYDSSPTVSQILSARCQVVFFSPSGVRFVLPLLQSYCDIQTLQVILLDVLFTSSWSSVVLTPIASVCMCTGICFWWHSQYLWLVSCRLLP